ncbi:MAG TPA: hypothetical protein VG347_24810 [Verrucomicrobiae bacterium]|nr:hypothetical protein [Verrucomicrobiae bacterium]
MNEEEIRLRLGYDAAAVERGTKQMLENQREHANTFKEIWKKTAEIVGGLFSIEKIIEFGKGLAESAHQIETIADRLNITTAEVQKLKHVADLTGSSIETIAGAFDKLAKSKEAALGGNGAETNAFKDFGLTIEELKAMAPEEIFNRLSESIEKTGINTKVTADLMALMGKSAGELKPVLREFAEDHNTAPVLPDSVIKNNAKTARLGTYAGEMFKASGSMWLSAISHPFKTYYDMFGNNGQVKFQDNNDRRMARLMAEDEKPSHGEAATFIVDLTKQAAADAKKTAELEKEILKIKESGREAGLSPEAKRLEIVKQIAGLEHDIAGAPFEGLSAAETAELRLQKEKLITQEKILQHEIDDQTTSTVRSITTVKTEIDRKTGNYPTIADLATGKYKNSPYSGLARDYQNALDKEGYDRANAVDSDGINLHGMTSWHTSRADILKADQDRVKQTLGNLGKVPGLLSPEQTMQTLNTTLANLQKKLDELHAKGGKEDPIHIADE